MGHLERLSANENDFEQITRTSKVPEDDHKAPLLVEDVPRLRNALLTLGTAKESSAQRAKDTGNHPPGVNIEAGSKNHESHILGNEVRTTEPIYTEELRDVQE